jgi:hypothetical protein
VRAMLESKRLEARKVRGVYYDGRWINVRVGVETFVCSNGHLTYSSQIRQRRLQPMRRERACIICSQAASREPRSAKTPLMQHAACSRAIPDAETSSERTGAGRSVD